MRKSGRRSTAELSLVPRRELPRPEPPRDLSEPAQQIWREVAGAFQPTWFVGCGPVLACYCETAVTACRIAAALSQCDTGSERFLELAKLHCALASSLAILGTKLRITPQATRDSRHTKLAPLPGGRPWEDDGSEQPEPAT